MANKEFTIDPQIQSWVDQQLQECGAYSPLELLLQSIRLDYNDYEAWRRSEFETLDSSLRGNVKKIKQMLQAADTYARHLKLIAEEEDYFPWQSDGSPVGISATALRVSIDKELRTLIGLRFVKQASGPQLDMFFNNPVVTIVNALQAALAHGDCGQAQQQLDKLYQTDPNHSDLGSYDRLVDVLRHSVGPVENTIRELDELKNAVPSAKQLLGLRARDYLVPLWRRLAKGLDGQSFSAEKPELHSSYAWYQAQDWAQAIEAILSVGGYQKTEVLLQLLAECAYRHNDSIMALKAWAQLCWLFPQTAEEALDQLNLLDPQMRQRWQRFLDSDPDGLFCTEEFPAWVLIQEPSLVKQLELSHLDEQGRGEKIFITVQHLLRARLAKQESEEIKWRGELKDQHPSLFKLMMKQV